MLGMFTGLLSICLVQIRQGRDVSEVAQICMCLPWSFLPWNSTSSVAAIASFRSISLFRRVWTRRWPGREVFLVVALQPCRVGGTHFRGHRYFGVGTKYKQ